MKAEQLARRTWSARLPDPRTIKTDRRVGAPRNAAQQHVRAGWRRAILLFARRAFLPGSRVGSAAAAAVSNRSGSPKTASGAIPGPVLGRTTHIQRRARPPAAADAPRSLSYGARGASELAPTPARGRRRRRRIPRRC